MYRGDETEPGCGLHVDERRPGQLGDFQLIRVDAPDAGGPAHYELDYVALLERLNSTDQIHVAVNDHGSDRQIAYSLVVDQTCTNRARDRSFAHGILAHRSHQPGRSDPDIRMSSDHRAVLLIPRLKPLQSAEIDTELGVADRGRMRLAAVGKSQNQPEASVGHIGFARLVGS